MNISGVKGYYRALRAAEESAGKERLLNELRAMYSKAAAREPAGSASPVGLSQKVIWLMGEESIAEECLIQGVMQMKRIHCLKRQVGSVGTPAKRHIVTEDGEDFGIHYRFKPCGRCRHWLTETEYKDTRRWLKWRGGWDGRLACSETSVMTEAS